MKKKRTLDLNGLVALVEKGREGGTSTSVIILTGPPATLGGIVHKL